MRPIRIYHHMCAFAIWKYPMNLYLKITHIHNRWTSCFFSMFRWTWNRLKKWSKKLNIQLEMWNSYPLELCTIHKSERNLTLWKKSFGSLLLLNLMRANDKRKLKTKSIYSDNSKTIHKNLSTHYLRTESSKELL